MTLDEILSNAGGDAVPFESSIMKEAAEKAKQADRAKVLNLVTEQIQHANQTMHYNVLKIRRLRKELDKILTEAKRTERSAKYFISSGNPLPWYADRDDISLARSFCEKCGCDFDVDAFKAKTGMYAVPASFKIR